jgi:type I restriction-modification system DNA methylase subunit
MANERITEEIAKKQLENLGYIFNSQGNTDYDIQKSRNKNIEKLLKTASKSGNGKGSPEFFLYINPLIIGIIECKADIKNHSSATMYDDPNKYAVDGVLHYAGFLKEKYNVIAIAISGQNEKELIIESFLYPKNSLEPKPLLNKDGNTIEQLLTKEEYINCVNYDPEIEKKNIQDIIKFSQDIHNFMRDHAKLAENEKPLLVSGTLLALQNLDFKNNYNEYSNNKIQSKWFNAIKEQIEDSEIPSAKKNSMMTPYKAISEHPELSKPITGYPNGALTELVKRIDENLSPYINYYHNYDIIGSFYGEFLKYTGGDKKALGIVLTPRHITELFSELANIAPFDKVLDICAGTGGFLISAMQKMIKQCETEEEKKEVKLNNLIGIEQQPNMFALCASNMILRGDGKSNLYQGSCFDEQIIKDIKVKHKCNVGMINPPYSQKDQEQSELSFLEHLLDMLEVGGTGIAIVPMSCVLQQSDIKRRLMKNHTLEAVMSMPTELFYPVGVVTCIVVFTAHKPHPESKEVWFGYWKDDGYVKTKNHGRIDKNEKYETKIKKFWLDMYHNKKVIPGLSVKRKVTADDEWCAEAYMETDYSKLTQDDFEKTVRDYAAFLVQNSTYDINKIESENIQITDIEEEK